MLSLATTYLANDNFSLFDELPFVRQVVRVKTTYWLSVHSVHVNSGIDGGVIQTIGGCHKSGKRGPNTLSGRVRWRFK